MKYLFSIIAFIFLFTSSSCSFQSTIFNRMAKETEGENLIISPLSIFQALSLCANGANGQTLKEMLDLLQSDSIDELNEINYKILSVIKDFSTIEIANAIMTVFTPLEDFRKISEKYFAPIEPLIDVDQVNDWCKNKTHGKIDKILDKLDPDVLIIILNAVYFKGEWKLKFEWHSTRKLPFYNLGSEEVSIDTMSQIDHFDYYEDKKVQAIKLNFVKDFMSAIIILPAEGTDINKYINSLSLSNTEYKQIIEGFRYSKVYLQLPKFELVYKKQLNQILKDLGMYEAFIPSLADFTNLKEEKDLFISKVIHKTYLKVFEDGCEAAAVTAIEGAGSAMPLEEEIHDMKVNRPFLFLLKNSKLPEGYDLVFMSKIETLE